MDATTIYHKSECSVKITKNSKGYNWEIKAYGDDLKKVEQEIKESDERLKATYPI